MNLMRNGGFELGDLSFWESGNACTLAITDAEWHRGVYGGLITPDGAGYAGIYHNDFVELNGYEIIDSSAWVRAADADWFKLVMHYYDDDQIEIGSVDSMLFRSTGAWIMIRNIFKSIPESVYCKVEINFYAADDTEIWYLDDLYLARIDLEHLITSDVELCDLFSLTASGDTSDDVKVLMGFVDYYADLNCTSLTGTAPTLDVDICELDIRGTEVVLGSFTQLNAAGSERIKINPPIGNSIYVKYTEGGIWTDCDFKADLTGVR